MVFSDLFFRFQADMTAMSRINYSPKSPYFPSLFPILIYDSFICGMDAVSR
jgi:hypothetical protein